jgi:hypothetical protein
LALESRSFYYHRIPYLLPDLKDTTYIIPIFVYGQQKEGLILLYHSHLQYKKYQQHHVIEKEFDLAFLYLGNYHL